MEKEKHDLPDTPLDLFHQWYEMAKAGEPNDPDAMSLATSTPDGRPIVRMILLKQADERGFKFHSNNHSFKGQHLAANPHAALCFHWKSLRKQVCVQGTVEYAPESETDEYFSTRPYERQLGAWASSQSSPLEHRIVLENKIEVLKKKYPPGTVPRPPHWVGYILKPERIEFWWSHPDRLHDRFEYTRQSDRLWTLQRLYP